MNEDTLIIIGTPLMVVLAAFYFLLQGAFKAEMKREIKKFSSESIVRIGQFAASHVILRCLWSGATFITGISFGMWFADPINRIISPIIPVSIFPAYALIALSIYVRLAFIFSEKIKFHYSDLFSPKEEDL